MDIVINIDCISETDEELKEWKEKFDEKISQQDKLISRLARDADDLEKTCSTLDKKSTDYVIEISKLQSAADVSLPFYKKKEYFTREPCF